MVLANHALHIWGRFAALVGLGGLMPPSIALTQTQEKPNMLHNALGAAVLKIMLLENLSIRDFGRAI